MSLDGIAIASGYCRPIPMTYRTYNQTGAPSEVASPYYNRTSKKLILAVSGVSLGDVYITIKYVKNS